MKLLDPQIQTLHSQIILIFDSALVLIATNTYHRKPVRYQLVISLLRVIFVFFPDQNERE